jgi:hypothetical protein
MNKPLHLRGTIYSAYTPEGNDSAIWTAQKWASTAAMLTVFLNDESQSKEDRDRAAEILAFVSALQKRGYGNFMIELKASALWESPDYFVLEEITDEDGVKHRECVSTNKPFPKPKPRVEIAPVIEGAL